MVKEIVMIDAIVTEDVPHAVFESYRMPNGAFQQGFEHLLPCFLQK